MVELNRLGSQSSTLIAAGTLETVIVFEGSSFYSRAR